MDRSGAEAKGPVDTGYVAYLIFFLMGAGGAKHDPAAPEGAVPTPRPHAEALRAS